MAKSGASRPIPKTPEEEVEELLREMGEAAPEGAAPIPVVKVSDEEDAAIKAQIRTQFVREYRTVEIHAKLNKSVGEMELARSQFNQCKQLLLRIQKLDAGEV